MRCPECGSVELADIDRGQFKCGVCANEWKPFKPNEPTRAELYRRLQPKYGTFYKDEDWRDILHCLEDWWGGVTGFIGSELDPSDYPHGLGSQTTILCGWCFRHGIEPMPLWELYKMIDGFGPHCRLQPMPSFTTGQISWAADRAQLIVERLRQMGTTDKGGIPRYTLETIPPLDTENGWVNAKQAAELEPTLSKRSMGDYRIKPESSTSVDGMSGIDLQGRVWRKTGPKNNAPVWYLASTLTNS